MGYRLRQPPKSDIDLQSLLNWGIVVCRSNGIRISNHVRLNDGICSRRDFLAITDRFANNRFCITFSTMAYTLYGNSRKKWCALMLHELCHTVRGCFNHGMKWKRMVRILNEAGYHINPKPYSTNPEKDMW